MYAVVDCNSFFVACEKVFRPDLEGQPVVVLSNNDGCVVARSYEAKRLGVPMGAPYFKHEKLFKANQIVTFSANFGLYGDFSQRVLTLLDNTGAAVEPYSVDEAFLRLADLGLSDYEKWGLALRKKILDWTGIPVSVGIGPTKTLAKAGAELAKQDPTTGGVILLQGRTLQKTEVKPSKYETSLQGRTLQKLEKLPVEDIWGVGFRSAPKLHRLGIKTATDLIQLSERWMRSFGGISAVRTLKELKGEDVFGWHVTYNQPAQHTIASTRSFPQPIRNLDELKAAIAAFVVRATYRLRQQQQLASRFHVFATTGKHAAQRGLVSVGQPLAYPMADTGLILEQALAAFSDSFHPGYSYKRAGVVLSELIPVDRQQLPLIETPTNADFDKRERLMTAFDAIRDRHGNSGIMYGVQTQRRQWQSRRDKLSPRYTTAWAELPVVRA